MKLFYIYFSSLILIFSFNKIYFASSQKIIFFDYFKKFLIFNLILFIFFLTLNLSNNFIIFFTFEDLFFFIIMYLITFLSFFLTIGLKVIKSPSEEIFEKINNKISYNKLYNKLKKKNIISLRYEDLLKQNLIILKKKNYYLTDNAKNFVKVFLFLKKILNIRVQG